MNIYKNNRTYNNMNIRNIIIRRPMNRASVSEARIMQQGLRDPLQLGTHQSLKITIYTFSS